MRIRLRNLESESGDLEAEWLGSQMLDRFEGWMRTYSKSLRIPKIKGQK
jgi:hypothetical protein